MKKLILFLFIFYSVYVSAQVVAIPQVTGLPAVLNSKVDKVAGKSLVADTSIVKLTGLQAGAQVNKLEGIQKNGVDLSITGKKVNITVPTTAAEIGAQPAGTYSTDIHGNISALNVVSGTNTGDETTASIKTKLGITTLSGVNTGDQTSVSGNAGTATKLQTSRTINGVAFDGTQNITINAVDATSRVASSLLGAANGVATLDASGIILTTQLPSYIDDVLEYANLAAFPATGETGKIYVAKDTNKTYRWSGSVYVYITSGAVDSVNGYTGVVSLSKSDLGLGNLDNTSDANKPISTATQAALNGKQASGTYSTDIHGNISALNSVSGTNTGDETLTSIKTKLGAASSSNAGYLTNTDFSNFSGKQNALGFTPYNATNPSGYISGITTGMVTTALGYTPLPTRTFGTAANNNTGDFYATGGTVVNSTKWGGLTFSGGFSSSLNGLLSYDGGAGTNLITLGDTRAWLGLGSNAYNSTSYLPLSGGTMSNSNLVSNLNTQYLNGVPLNNIVYGGRDGGLTSLSPTDDLNNLYRAGFYSTFNSINSPEGGDAGLVNIPTWNGSNSSNRYNLQIMNILSNNHLYFRGTSSDGHGTWNSIYHSGNLTNTLSTNYIPKWNGSSLTNSLIHDDGSTISIGDNSSSGIGLRIAANGVNWYQKSNSNGDLEISNGDGVFVKYIRGVGTTNSLFNGKVIVSNSSQSDMDGTTINDGSIQSYGGISAVKDINAGGNINAFGNMSATGTIMSEGHQLTPIYQNQTTVDGSTSGHMICAMPIRTGTYKKVIIDINGMSGTATYTFPVAFTKQPEITSEAAAGANQGLSTTSMTVSGLTYSRLIIIEGY